MSLKNFSISFCIICMNRLYQLKETLEKNMRDNTDYSALQFVVLNYNSKDGMDDWVLHEMKEFIQSGRLVYYHTTEPTTFSHSHAKNLVFKLATGDIVCNINADHFTGKHFAEYINQCFSANPEIVLTTIDYFKTNKDYHVAKDLFGKVCVKKTDFVKLGGFDERMQNYGFEDWDFVNRLELSGLQRKLITNPQFLQFIAHDDHDRYILRKEINSILSIYISYCDPARSHVITLFDNGTFKNATILDNAVKDAEDYQYAYIQRNYQFENSIKESDWIIGRWVEEHERFCFYPQKCAAFSLEKMPASRHLINRRSEDIYFRITEKACIAAVTDFTYLYENRRLMEINLEKHFIEVNRSGFGSGRVFKNFEKVPVEL